MAVTALIDYGIGNLHSAFKAFQLMSKETQEKITVVSQPEEIEKADRIVLPGDGAFYMCKVAIDKINGLSEAIDYAVNRKSCPFLGICVGMQMLASFGYEGKKSKGFDWIKGKVKRIQSKENKLKIPHIGWNNLMIEKKHPVLYEIETGDHAYFIHSYHFSVENLDTRYAYTEYGIDITAIIGKNNIIGTQFHPEKSQATGLRLIRNFLNWSP